MTDQDNKIVKSEGESPPRAFAQGTGVMLQAFGVILLLSTCCVCSLSFLWDPQRPPSLVDGDPSVEQTRRSSNLTVLMDEPGRLGVMLTIMSTSVAGLAMAGFGLGLQAERLRAAWGAAASTSLWFIVLVGAGVALWTGESSINARIWHMLLAALALLLSGFAIAALRQVLADPPPADIDILPPDFKVPYSIYHEDPPDVRLEKEIANRRARLEAEHRELREMEDNLREKRQKGDS
jgi:hypothetical protein